MTVRMSQSSREMDIWACNRLRARPWPLIDPISVKDDKASILATMSHLPEREIPFLCWVPLFGEDEPIFNRVRARGKGVLCHGASDMAGPRRKHLGLPSDGSDARTGPYWRRLAEKFAKS